MEFEEEKKIEYILKQQLIEEKKRCEELEEEVAATRKELEKFQALYHQNQLSIKASKELNNILSIKGSLLLKTGLVYEEGSSRNHSKNKKSDELIKFQRRKQSKYKHTLPTKGNKDEIGTKIRNSDQKYQPIFAQEQSQQKGRQPIFRYPIFFHGYYYCCCNFGHKAANCAFNFRSMQLRISKNCELLQHRTR